MSAKLVLSPKQKPLAIGAIVAWLLFLMAVSSDGAEGPGGVISADCLSCPGSEEVDFSSYTFNPSTVDVAKGLVSARSNRNGFSNNAQMNLVSRRSVMDVYYDAKELIPSHSDAGRNGRENAKAGFADDRMETSTKSIAVVESAEEEVEEKSPSRKRRVMSLLYLLVCAETQR